MTGARLESTWRHRAAIPAGVALCLALAVGCGASEQPSGAAAGDEEAIIALITESFTTQDAAHCDTLYTQAFMEQVTGERGPASVEGCRENEAEQKDSAAKSVDVSTLELDGDHASATVEASGGSYDGATFELTLVATEPEGLAAGPSR